MSPTMMPFLYQTRTLASLRWTRYRSILRPQLGDTVKKRNFGSRSAQHSADIKHDDTSRNLLPMESIRSENHIGEGNGSLSIKRTTNMQGPEPHFSGNVFEELRNTRSPPEKRHDENSGLIIRKVYEREEVEADQSDIPWDIKEIDYMGNGDPKPKDLYSAEDDIFDDENEIEVLTRDSDPSTDRKSTITPSERAAFQTIFTNIFAKTRTAQSYDDHLFSDESKGVGQSQIARAKLETIVGSAMKRDKPQSRQEMETVVSRYPPSLRAAAARAIGLDFDDTRLEVEATDEEAALENDRLEQLRKPERERVEALMSAAETDFELWSVMEEEVFPLIAKLGLEEAPKEETRAKKRGKSRLNSKQPPPVPKVKEISQLTTTADGISPLSLYGPLYPSYLLLGLRLFDRSFAKPSPLALSILPKIKSLGLISQVLGASTQLYNELLIIHWYRQDDFRGVLSLLAEMERSGLDFDDQTLNIIVDIMKMQASISRGERGETLKALWSLPEFAPNTFKRWAEKIRITLKEKNEAKRGLSY